MDKRQRIDERGDWEKALSSKFQDYEPAIPELPPFNLHRSRRHNSRWKWLVISTSIAATIILALLLTKKGTEELNNPLRISSPDYVIAKNDDQIIEIATTPKNLSATQDKRNNQKSAKGKEREIAVVEELVGNEVSSEDICETVVQNDNKSISESEQTTENLSGIQPNKYTENHRKISLQKNKRPIQLSVFSSGLTLNTDAVTMSEVGSGILSEKKADYSVREIPLFEIGSTLLFPLTQRLSIQSGLKYSWYRIEVKDNSFISNDFHILDVHALGVPFDIQYTFYDSKAWRLYGQYGLGIYIPFKSTITGASNNKGGATISLDTSVALGLEYSITRELGLYTSFGVTYDLLQMKSNLPDADISRWHGKVEAGIRFRINR